MNDNVCYAPHPIELKHIFVYDSPLSRGTIIPHPARPKFSDVDFSSLKGKLEGLDQARDALLRISGCVRPWRKNTVLVDDGESDYNLTMIHARLVSENPTLVDLLVVEGKKLVYYTAHIV